MWPEGSNIRQVFCVLTCAVGLKMYSHMLENANASAKEKEGKTEHFPLEVKFLCNFLSCFGPVSISILVMLEMIVPLH